MYAVSQPPHGTSTRSAEGERLAHRLAGAGVRDRCAPPALAELHHAALRAKIVSSLPIPTPSPGLKRVPRWRTMISPPVTVWPAKIFTPRRLALESRPLRLEPRPFLCAISGLLFLLRPGARRRNVMPVTWMRVSSWRWPVRRL